MHMSTLWSPFGKFDASTSITPHLWLVHVAITGLIQYFFVVLIIEFIKSSCPLNCYIGQSISQSFIPLRTFFTVMSFWNALRVASDAWDLHCSYEGNVIYKILLVHCILSLLQYRVNLLIIKNNNEVFKPFVYFFMMNWIYFFLYDCIQIIKLTHYNFILSIV